MYRDKYIHWQVVYPVWALVCRRCASMAYRYPFTMERGQLPILIYWNPSLPIFYPIPSRTGVCTRAKTQTIYRYLRIANCRRINLIYKLFRRYKDDELSYVMRKHLKNVRTVERFNRQIDLTTLKIFNYPGNLLEEQFCQLQKIARFAADDFLRVRATHAKDTSAVRLPPFSVSLTNLLLSLPAGRRPTLNR